jgi:hypothetical protein
MNEVHAAKCIKSTSCGIYWKKYICCCITLEEHIQKFKTWRDFTLPAQVTLFNQITINCC